MADDLMHLTPEEGRSFDHPWQAQAFAMVVALHKAGKFSWSRWVEVFSAEIAAAPAAAGESINDAYYRQWLAALEKITLVNGMLESQSVVEERVHRWRQAYLNTPHGSPVLLTNADCEPASGHEHSHRREPVAVIPAKVRKEFMNAP